MAENSRSIFIGQIIDTFEEFLLIRDVRLDSDDNENMIYPSIIYGSDYTDLYENLEMLFQEWGISPDALSVPHDNP